MRVTLILLALGLTFVSHAQKRVEDLLEANLESAKLQQIKKKGDVWKVQSLDSYPWSAFTVQSQELKNDTVLYEVQAADNKSGFKYLFVKKTDSPKPGSTLQRDYSDILFFQTKRGEVRTTKPYNRVTKEKFYFSNDNTPAGEHTTFLFCRALFYSLNSLEKLPDDYVPDED